MASPQQIKTPLTEQFGLKHPIMLAGMNVAAGPELAAAVTNAGGIGVIGGVGYTPAYLRKQVQELKSYLKDKNGAFGVDLLLPKVGGGARKTNTDYTNGQLPELIDIIIESGAKLFVSAVGVPPVEVVQKLHKANIVVAGIIGHPKHAPKVLDAGVDMVIFQGGEGGGHTGDVPLSIIAPRVVDICRGRKSPLTGKPIITVAAGGIFNGRGLAASICYGADGVWVGTRFVASKEAGAPKAHKEAVLKSTHETDIRTIIFTGRPLRVFKTPYIEEWESRPQDIKRLTEQGIIPVYHDLDNDDEEGTKETQISKRFLLGKCASVIDDIKPAKEIMDEMINEAVDVLRNGSQLLVGGVARL
ncbi:probable dioxygenases related to 2-nitropropane dioxygenase [Melanopsichium pennsylvanicum]|uniref:2-nitropropane dioxygenase n=2 Tax=Melanopsichium pennsylvanicum TaxID=63383 RepID=A0A077R5N9_9BASI|nr:2-nitropropane dioxygenase [Melanopsichium pennsylvanicum 4]SNX85935.1 probable dioxygenases related to 2-nitropropane dioxygenase [Melanopsichium pennsylvanicum]